MEQPLVAETRKGSLLAISSKHMQSSTEVCVAADALVGKRLMISCCVYVIQGSATEMWLTSEFGHQTLWIISVTKAGDCDCLFELGLAVVPIL
jgi:hypothetical protein